jgi:N-acetylneuraminic acid mutarotase
MNDLNPSRKPAAVRRAGGYMKHLNHITLGFVITFVLVGCLAATAQGVGVFTSTSTANEAHEGHTATLLTNGMVLIAGGYTINIYESGLPPELTSDTELYEYDPAGDNGWSVPGNLNDYRAGHTATLLTNGQVLVAGGGVSSAELYNPVTGVWTYTGSLVTERSDHTATRLPNGKVLVAGGLNYNGSKYVYLASAELYDPATGHWTATGSLAFARDGHTATLLPNGKVLVAGGGVISAELYDPATGHWTATGSLGAARYGNTATLLPNGKVLVAGGATNGSELASAEMYDPATGHWTATGSLGAARSGHTATLLPNGKVLVVGGNIGVSFAELYDPTTGAWSPTGSLGANGPLDHTATLLANGQVLVAGGFYNGVMVVGGVLYDSGTSSLNPFLNPVKLGDGSFQFGFINGSGPSYGVLASTNLSATVNTWTNLGAATEMPAGSGLFQFTDHQAPNYPQRFYRVSSPR